MGYRDVEPYLTSQEWDGVGQGPVAHARLQPVWALSSRHSNTLKVMPAGLAASLKAWGWSGVFSGDLHACGSDVASLRSGKGSPQQ